VLTFIFNELAEVVGIPKRLEHWCLRVCVMFTNECLKVLGSLWSVVEGHLREEVVDDVEVSD